MNFSVLIPGEKAKVIEAVVNDFATFLHTKDGAHLICNAIDYMDPKDRKNLLKGFKGQVKDFLLKENSFSHLVIIKILSTVDDTVLIKKTIVNVVFSIDSLS